MKSIISAVGRMSIWKFLKKYKSLIFWLIWGVVLSVAYGYILKDFLKSFMIFMGFGIYLGLILQFTKSKWLKTLAVALCVLVAVSMIWKPMVSSFQSILGKKISRSFLVDDVRQLASILEETHPDPYSHGGGKIEFHRRMQKLIQAIPEEGLTKSEFYRHLCPFMAAIGDGHTSFWEPYRLNGLKPGGIPLFFHGVEDVLYVGGVINVRDQDLIGAKLISVEDISFEKLMNRQRKIKGYDNEYQLKRNLGYDGSLWFGQRMKHLLP